MHVPCIYHACGPDELDDGAEATAGREALGRRQVVARLAPRTAAYAAAVAGRRGAAQEESRRHGASSTYLPRRRWRHGVHERRAQVRHGVSGVDDVVKGAARDGQGRRGRRGALDIGAARE